MEGRKRYIIYMHIFPNGKKYIGVTNIRSGETYDKACLRRWGNDGTGYKTQIVWNAICKFGWDNVKHRIIATDVPENEIDELEIDLIKKYNTQIDSGRGYNVDYGGKHRVVSDRTRKKISEALSGEKHPNYGKHHSEITKERIRNSNLGKIVSEESRRKMSASQTWQKGENNPRYGKHCSDETKDKIRKQLKGRYIKEKSYWYGKHLSNHTKQILSSKAKDRYKDKHNHPNYGKKMRHETCLKISQMNSHPILVYNLFGEFVDEYKSATYYANMINVSVSAVCNAAKFVTITCKDKLIFYKDDFTETELHNRIEYLKNTRKFKKFYYYNKTKPLFDKGYTRKQVSEMVGISWDVSDACYKMMLQEVA